MGFELSRPTQEEILKFWKEIVIKEKKSDHYDLSEKSEWVEKYFEFGKMVEELSTINAEDGIRKILRTMFLPSSELIWASKPFLFFKLLNEANLRELNIVKDIFVDVGYSKKFKESWVDNLVNLIEKKYPEGTERFKALKALIRNVLGEAYGKLHYEDSPIKNI